MTNIRPAAAPLVAAACFALACCVPPAPEPTPAPPQRPSADVPVTTQANPPASVVLPPSDWIDAPQTPGDWRYSALQGGSRAQFGISGQAPVLALVCTRANRQVQVIRYGAGGSADVPVRIRTETANRHLSGSAGGDHAVVTLPASDPLLDAMAFSRGRFAVETYGAAPLYLPSWPEVSRVIEDCR